MIRFAILVLVVALSANNLVSVSAQLPRGPISEGEKSTRVSAIQNLLMSLKYPISVTGAFGVHTKNFVTQFQKDEGLQETGVMDKETLTRLITKVQKSPGRVCMESRGSYAANFLLPNEASKFGPYHREFYISPVGESRVKAIQQSNGLPVTGAIDLPTWLVLFQIDGTPNAPRANIGELESRESGYDEGPVRYTKDDRVSVYEGPDEGEEDPECRNGGSSDGEGSAGDQNDGDVPEGSLGRVKPRASVRRPPVKATTKTGRARAARAAAARKRNGGNGNKKKGKGGRKPIKRL